MSRRTVALVSLVSALLAFGAISALPASAVRAQEVSTLPGGQMEVRLTGCVVFYDSTGRRTHNAPGCRGDQVSYADNAVRDYVGSVVRRDGRGADGGPQIAALRNGQVQVTFGNGRCAVFYSDRGERVRSLPDCSRDQIRRADNAVAEDRRDQGLDRRRADRDDRRPEVVVSRNGRGRVIFDNDCTVFFDRWGDRQGSSRSCETYQLSRADRAMNSFRRERGLD